MNLPKNSTPIYKLLLSVFAALVLLSACSSIPTAYKAEVARTAFESADKDEKTAIQRLDSNCYSDVLQRETSVGNSNQASQQIALAKAASRCIEKVHFYPQHPDNQLAMQLNALAVVNYIKAGETQNAAESLSDFRTKFPQQDLLFSDYTSFVDTAVALLQHKNLSARQMQVLNINASLRSELKRQEYWLTN